MRGVPDSRAERLWRAAAVAAASEITERKKIINGDRPPPPRHCLPNRSSTIYETSALIHTYVIIFVDYKTICVYTGYKSLNYRPAHRYFRRYVGRLVITANLRVSLRADRRPAALGLPANVLSIDPWTIITVCSPREPCRNAVIDYS